ncbi:histidine-type phosphatase [Krasilnikovia sp. MM14-A1259]|uniref:histidine-type phosphatase n=1 Tax=Krasilnikovia sp. MM14-A1259 TaxID=3373539 RepID=UPI0038272C06
MRVAIGVVAAVCAVPATVAGLHAASAALDRHDRGRAATPAEPGGPADFLTTNTPYRPDAVLGSYGPAPAGFVPGFTEMIARHGARALGDEDDIVFLEQVIAQAQAAGKVKPLANDLLTELKSLDAANRKLGFGALSALGKQEHADLGARLVQRLPDLFAKAAPTGRRVTVVNSGIPRAADSGAAFTAAMTSALPSLKPLVKKPVADTRTLYFHKEPVNADYATYVKHDATLNATLKKITYSKESDKDAVTCLGALFADDFVGRLASDGYTFTDSDGKKQTRNAVDATIALFNVYAITPGLSREGVWHFDRFIDRKTAEHFAFVDDATTFYEKGPGLSGSTITFKMASVLEDDFFHAVAAYRSGTSTDVARLRFAHAETIIPLAALMRLPGSEVQVPRTDTFSPSRNPWRGANVAPYAANMQWDVFRNGSGQVLIRMLYNEKETHFKSECKPFTAGSYFYDFTELQRCYGR